MQVRQIEAKDTYDIRSRILRPGRDISTCYFDGDTKENTFHLGSFVDEKLVSVASFYLESHPDLEDEFQYRLRGMATLEDYQKMGMSQALLNTAAPLIKQNHINTLWCNARTSAQGFYEKSGFVVRGDIFDIPDVGPHIVMYKKID